MKKEEKEIKTEFDYAEMVAYQDRVKDAIKDYIDMKIKVPVCVGNASWGVPSRQTRTEIMTVGEALKYNAGTHWTAENEKVQIHFNEDYGHRIKIFK